MKLIYKQFNEDWQYRYAEKAFKVYYIRLLHEHLCINFKIEFILMLYVIDDQVWQECTK